MAANPQAILQLLKSSQGGPAGPAGAVTGTQAASDSLGPAMNELQAADPGYALKEINDLKKRIANMIPSLAFKAPAASRALVSCFKGIDAAIKELTQAEQTAMAVGGPIKNSAVPMPQPPTEGMQAPDVSKSAGIGM